MNTKSMSYAGYVDGTSALKPADSYFRLIDGTDRRKPARTTSRQDSLSNSAGRASNRAGVLMFTLLFTVIALAFASSAVMEGLAYSKAASSISEQVITVMPGDTLSSLAHEHGVSGMDQAHMVHWLRSRNDLSSSFIQAGQKLVVAQ